MAFRAGAVMGFALCALGLGCPSGTTLSVPRATFQMTSEWATMMDCVAGFGLGGSSVAMFGRVGGGIYTKAADVGADLVGKVVHGLEEDDPKPATRRRSPTTWATMLACCGHGFRPLWFPRGSRPALLW